MRRKLSLLLFLLPSLIIGLIAVILMNWHRDTHVSLKLIVDRVQFVIGGKEKASVIDAGNVKSLVFDDFENIRVEPEKLTLIGASRSRQVQSDGNTILIRAADIRYQPNAILSVADLNGGGQLTIDALRATPGATVIFEASDDADELAVQLHKQQVSGNITSNHPVRFDLNHCDISGTNGVLDAQQNISMVAQLKPYTSINFSGRQDSIRLTMLLPRDNSRGIFPQTTTPITDVIFERQVETGAVISSVVGESEIAYPDYPDTKVPMAPRQFIKLADLKQFAIKNISWNPADKSFVLDMEGIAGHIRTGSPDFNIDRRKTAFDSLRNNNQILILIGLLGWGVTTTVGAYKFYKEWKSEAV
jgi:hypothetical protein